MKRLLPMVMILLAVLNLADMAITAWLLTHSCAVIEANMMMNALWTVSPVLFAVYKAALSACLFCLARHVSNARRWVWFAVAPAAVGYCGVVGWSIYVLVNTL